MIHTNLRPVIAFSRPPCTTGPLTTTTRLRPKCSRTPKCSRQLPTLRTCMQGGYAASGDAAAVAAVLREACTRAGEYLKAAGVDKDTSSGACSPGSTPGCSPGQLLRNQFSPGAAPAGNYTARPEVRCLAQGSHCTLCCCPPPECGNFS